MPHRVRVQDLYDFLHKRLDLEWLAGQEGRDRALLEPGGEDASRVIAGHLNYIHPSRVQIVGAAERRYLDDLSPGERRQALQHLFAANPAAVVLVHGENPPADLLAGAEQHRVALFRSPLPDAQVLDNLQYFGALFLSRKTTLHGVFLEVLGMGVLLTGDAAVGKSELALELISRGNRLVADDAPELARVAPDLVSGTCPPVLRDFLEVRGLGVLNIRAMFGDSAIRRTKSLRLIVHLQRMSTQELSLMDRLSGSDTSRDVLGVPIPEVTVPVAPGRNLAILVESAVRNHLLKLDGYDAVEAFVQRHQRIMADGA
jgi:HPr kinase/phosphorylase